MLNFLSTISTTAVGEMSCDISTGRVMTYQASASRYIPTTKETISLWSSQTLASAATSITFSSLDTSAEAWLLHYRIFGKTSTAASILFQPNGDTTAANTSGFHLTTTSAGSISSPVDTSALAGILIGSIASSSATPCLDGWAVFRASTGQYRLLYGIYTLYSTPETSTTTTGGWWTNTATSLSSIVVTSTASSGLLTNTRMHLYRIGAVGGISTQSGA